MSFKQRLRQNIDAVVTTALAEDRIVGTAIAISRGGTTVYRAGHGFADREARQPMSTAEQKSASVAA